MNREQRALENLHSWAARGNEWAKRVAAWKASELIPDRLHPAYRPSRKFTKERIK